MFDLYTDFEASSIDSWNQLEYEFLDCFYSTRRSVSTIWLTNSRQWNEEPLIHYINRWRNVGLNCKDRLSQTSTVEICIQRMYWELPYIIQGIMPKTFEEFATRAHNMELSIIANEVGAPSVQEIEDGGQSSDDDSSEESKTIHAIPIKS